MQDNLKIHRVVGGAIQNNTYFLQLDGRNDCVIIDPADADQDLQALEQLGLKPEIILLTHGHFDHTMGVHKIRHTYDIPVAIHEADADMLLGSKKSMSQSVLNRQTVTEKADILLQDGQEIEAAGISFRVLHTPGHTKGGVCFIVGNNIFSGDTLFYLDAGRTDLPGGNEAELVASIQRIFELPGDYKVYPGHEDFTSLDFERENNPFMRYHTQNKGR